MTAQYKAALYTVVKWNRISDIEDENYQNTSVYLFPGSLKGIDELWKIEQKKKGV